MAQPNILVDDGPHIRQWSHKCTLKPGNSYRLVALQSSGHHNLTHGSRAWGDAGASERTVLALVYEQTVYGSVEYMIDGGDRDHCGPELCTEYAMFFLSL